MRSLAPVATLGLLVCASYQNFATQNLDKHETETALLNAVKSGNKKKTASLIAQGVNINARNEEGFSPLMIAVIYQIKGMAKLLLEHGAEVYENTQVIPFVEAVNHGDRTMVELLLSYNANINAMTSDGVSSLVLAAARGNMDMVTLLLAHHANIEIRNHDGQNPLMIAVLNRHHDVAKKLLEHGAHVNARDYANRTALMFAVQAGNLMQDDNKKTIELLLSYNANVQEKDDKGNTALSFTNKRTLRILLLAAALEQEAPREKPMLLSRIIFDKFAPCTMYTSPLVKAACTGSRESVEQLLAQGSNINEAEEDGTTALMIAARREEGRIVALLAKRGANANLETKGGGTAFEYALESGSEGMRNLILYMRGEQPLTSSEKVAFAFALLNRLVHFIRDEPVNALIIATIVLRFFRVPGADLA